MWITSEDNGPQLGCYGDLYADTPNIDALAAKSLRYRRCWSNAPVCAPARTTIISGMYATSLGGQHMRSGPYLKHVDYMFQTPTTRVWKELFDAGKLNEAQAKFWKTKPVEELFDLRSDPDEVVNLSADPEHFARTATMRKVVQDWMVQTRDLGLLAEAEIHRLAGETPPRQFALNQNDYFAGLASAAFGAMDAENGSSLEELAKLSADADSGTRFWAVRGLAIRPSDGSGIRDRSLRKATDDASPSVAIAACDGLLTAENQAIRERAVHRLIDLANVEKVGHFAAIAALNVLDMNAELDSQTRAKLEDLPRQVRTPPTRVGKYVSKLIDHAIKTD